MKTIENIELLKKLQPYIKDMETEYVYYDIIEGEDIFIGTKGLYGDDYIKYKTLTLEEAIELLPVKIKINGETGYLDIFKRVLERGKNNKIISGYYVDYSAGYFHKEKHWIGHSNLLLAIEKMLEYLIDNNLLGNSK